MLPILLLGERKSWSHSTSRRLYVCGSVANRWSGFLTWLHAHWTTQQLFGMICYFCKTTKSATKLALTIGCNMNECWSPPQFSCMVKGISLLLHDNRLGVNLRLEHVDCVVWRDGTPLEYHDRWLVERLYDERTNGTRSAPSGKARSILSERIPLSVSRTFLIQSGSNSIFKGCRGRIRVGEQLSEVQHIVSNARETLVFISFKMSVPFAGSHKQK